MDNLKNMSLEQFEEIKKYCDNRTTCLGCKFADEGYYLRCTVFDKNNKED